MTGGWQMLLRGVLNPQTREHKVFKWNLAQEVKETQENIQQLLNHEKLLLKLDHQT